MSLFSARALRLPLRLPMRRAPAWGAAGNTSFAASRWGESTHAELAWGRSRARAERWGWAGAATGALIAMVCFAPATWLTSWISSASGQRLMLVDARGSVWSGSAVAVLTGGPGSRDAAALPGRLSWTAWPQGLALAVRLAQGCCLSPGVALRIEPGWGGWRAALNPAAESVGQWPGGWLIGLGTPWNTLRLGGTVQVRSTGIAVESTQGRWRLQGGMTLELLGASSRLSTLDTLGSYRLDLQGEPLLTAGAPASPSAAGGVGGGAQITLSTLEGALQLSGSGTWGIGGLRFAGEATSVDPDDPTLSNLLNILGRREGARSVISIGSP